MPIIEEIEEISDTHPPPHHHHHHHHRRQRGGSHADTRENHQSVPIGKPFTYSGPRKILFVLLKWIIMTFVLALFLIFIGFAALVVIHFFLTNTAVQHHRRRRGRGRGQASPQSLIALGPVHDLLPFVGYSAADQTARDCAICLEGFKEGDPCRKLPDCGHLFHVHCVDFWLTKKPNCPVCRTRVQLDCGSSGSLHNSDDEWKFWWPVGA
ncbi:OLC1v1035356C1 [Oldenlandia corymbosa var. corymbosa]|uniref:OLC1v1035356C1 n=1 Tax=Oldenlandia corymbosa var. corymbosa TaxID=529605 RepID=A0AAV1CTJ0_OLDCO|nr:OLC1v1035356C1 [Oldenlandia corymbosa var. corymbosa]